MKYLKSNYQVIQTPWTPSIVDYMTLFKKYSKVKKEQTKEQPEYETMYSQTLSDYQTDLFHAALDHVRNQHKSLDYRLFFNLGVISKLVSPRKCEC